MITGPNASIRREHEDKQTLNDTGNGSENKKNKSGGMDTPPRRTRQAMPVSPDWSPTQPRQPEHAHAGQSTDPLSSTSQAGQSNDGPGNGPIGPKDTKRDYQDKIVARTVTLQWLLNVCPKEIIPRAVQNNNPSKEMQKLLRLARLLRRSPVDTVAVLAWTKEHITKIKIHVSSSHLMAFNDEPERDTYGGNLFLEPNICITNNVTVTVTSPPSPSAT